MNANKADLKISPGPKVLSRSEESKSRELGVGALYGLCPPPPGFGAHSVGREPCGLETISQANTFLKVTAGCWSVQLWALSPTVAFRGAIWKAQTESAFQSSLASHLLSVVNEDCFRTLLEAHLGWAK